MGEGKECVLGKVIVLRILFRALGGFCSCYNLQAKTLLFVVAAGLFYYGTGSCLAGCLSMGVDVPADGQGREVRKCIWGLKY